MLVWNQWSQEDDLELLRLWDKGWSASRIAIRFPGKSRNAIIGRVNRLRLKGVPIMRRKEPKPGRPPTAAAKGPTGPQHKPAASLPLPATAPTPASAISFEQLGPRTCRYPYGDVPPFLYCGAETWEFSPYCAYHTGKCMTVQAVSRLQQQQAAAG
jgi:hypothetical protein